jgi:hypothetical protein
MSTERDMEIAVQKFAGTYLKDLISIYSCNVDSVDTDNRMIDCTPIGGDADTSLPGVSLCSENNNGFILFPKVGSTVIIGVSTRNTAFVLMYSDIDSVQFMDGSLGGMVITPNLVTRLNDIETKINDLINVFNSWTPVAYDGGAALKTALTTWVSTQLTPTVRDDIENTLITQGINT